MRDQSITVRAEWDDEAGVYVISSDDVFGLNLEAEADEDIVRKVNLAIGDLAEFDPSIAALAGHRLDVMTIHHHAARLAFA